jgi:hypothetical protein
LGPADVVQELYLQRLKWADRHRTLGNGLLPRPLPTCSKGAFAWLRRIAQRRLIDCHRRYFGSRKRDPAKEASLRSDGAGGAGWNGCRMGWRAVRRRMCELRRIGSGGCFGLSDFRPSTKWC